MIKHSVFSLINNEKIIAYAMAYYEDKIEFHEEQLKINDQDTIEILSYAMLYLENRITYHEDLISEYQGDKESLVQFSLIARYKQELEELIVLSKKLISLNKLEKTKVIETNRDLIEELSGLTFEKLNSDYDLQSLKKVASALKIQGRSKMDKTRLCLKIELYLNELNAFLKNN